MIETHVTSTDAPDQFSHMLAEACYGDVRFLISRYGTMMGAVVGWADVQYLRERDRDVAKQLDAEAGGKPEPNPQEIYAEWKERIRRGEMPQPKTGEDNDRIGKILIELECEKRGWV